MKKALEEAESAFLEGEVPVGAVAVFDNKIIASNHNRKEQNNDPTAHAEILTLRDASKVLGRSNLSGVHLYVTLEPCIMCSGAIILSRISGLTFGCSDPKSGGVRSLYALCEDPRLNHNLPVFSGIMKNETSEILSRFFADLRTDKS